MALRFSTENEFDRDIRRMLARAEMDLDEEAEREDLRMRIAALAEEERSAPALARVGLPAGLERRFATLELRAETAGGRNVLEGYAANFGYLSTDLGGFREQLAAGCFARSLKSRDCVMLFSHDPAKILARSSAGTLWVNEDSDGLRFRAELAATTDGNDCFENVQNGNVSGMSFGMIVRNDFWDEIEDPGDDEDDDDDEDKPKYRGKISRRTVLDCDLLEISPVVFPAYSSSSVAAAARALFPVGMPQEIRSRIAHAGAGGAISEAEQEFLLKLKLKAALLTLDL